VSTACLPELVVRCPLFFFASSCSIYLPFYIARFVFAPAESSLYYNAVEDIYDISNGDMSAPKDGFGFLNSLGDFVNGMMRL
jgi:hypothetical protein